MKRISIQFFVTLLFLSVFFQRNLQAQPKDTTYVMVIENSFKILDEFLLQKTISTGSVNQAIVFFEKLTGIGSEAWGDFRGKLFPIQKDVNQWKAWCYLNKDNLFWDKEKREVIFRVSVKPPDKAVSGI